MRVGFQQTIIVTSGLMASRKQELIAAVIGQSPFIRLPQRTASELAQHAMFGLPELTDYLFENDSDQEQATELCGRVENELLAFSTSFPDVRFVLIEAECAGGTCLYGGWICEHGHKTREVTYSKAGHRELLGEIGLQLVDDYFDPFRRSYFV